MPFPEVRDLLGHCTVTMTEKYAHLAPDNVRAAVGGRGITRVLSYMIAPQLQDVALEVLLEDYEPPAVPIHVLHNELGQTSARVRAIVEYLAQRMRTDPALAS